MRNERDINTTAETTPRPGGLSRHFSHREDDVMRKHTAEQVNEFLQGYHFDNEVNPRARK
ncbi:hypothetical protein ABN57_004294, partial [Salmonella enterica subsp. enterica serovar Nima]|nr:hypothetical protein [Salmonella enterica subsp. enterica serovar Nima]